VTQNLVRGARVGIALSLDPEAGSCLISQNMISGAREGAIRAMRHGVPVGPDLAREPVESKRAAIAGNLAL
jgi:hypothetical protein